MCKCCAVTTRDFLTAITGIVTVGPCPGTYCVFVPKHNITASHISLTDEGTRSISLTYINVITALVSNSDTGIVPSHDSGVGNCRIARFHER